MVYPVKDRETYYDYWIWQLETINKIFSAVNPLKSRLDEFIVADEYLNIIRSELDLKHCNGLKTEDIHKLWCYLWKIELADMLVQLSQIERELYRRTSDYEEIVEEFQKYQKKQLEYLEINIKVLKSEKEAIIIDRCDDNI